MRSGGPAVDGGDLPDHRGGRRVGALARRILFAALGPLDERLLVGEAALSSLRTAAGSSLETAVLLLGACGALCQVLRFVREGDRSAHAAGRCGRDPAVALLGMVTDQDRLTHGDHVADGAGAGVGAGGIARERCALRGLHALDADFRAGAHREAPGLGRRGGRRRRPRREVGRSLAVRCSRGRGEGRASSSRRASRSRACGKQRPAAGPVLARSMVVQVVQLAITTRIARRAGRRNDHAESNALLSRGRSPGDGLARAVGAVRSKSTSSNRASSMIFCVVEWTPTSAQVHWATHR